MKFAIPEISWHNRDPVLSVDFQPKADATEPLRLATGGTDSHVLIWYISTTDTGSVNLEVAADLTRHQKAVNVVRWSPNGQFLASGDDESIIFIWKKTDKEPAPVMEQSEEQYKESWVIHKTLRGHMEDVLDISWSANSLHLASGSVDNKLLIWDLNKGKYSSILTDHKGFVQGVSWDPKNQMIATASSDRRLQFSPDGLLLAVPSGRIEPEQGKVDIKPINAVYIYTRYSLKVPACILPCGEAALVTRWSPRLYGLREGGPAPAFPSPRRMILAIDLTWSRDGRTLVASSTDGYCSVITFAEGELGEVLPEEVAPEPTSTPAPEPMETEEQQAETPKAEVEKPQIKETKAAGKIDSFIKFKAPEKSPKKQKTEPQPKTPVKIDVLEEVAMPSWSDNSNTEIIKPKEPEAMIVDDSEDIKLVYEETEGAKSTSTSPDSPKTSVKTVTEKSPEQSSPKSNKTEETAKMLLGTPTSSNAKSTSQPSTPKSSVENYFLKQAKVTDVKDQAVKSAPSPKAPRRVSFVTLSSPKNAKKK
ncbi:hypothetical protein HF086_008113 [Spodoptera exigua]|uniref:CAF1B/HIR1 beta-propeller domain-containing protein n=1 Tax=Spodoptera exigua TaxID=7107 RepID=A0A922MP23_SPOEX|nr:hypothetical protein HF086_008113 [Spodoptera exigua]